MCLAKKNLELSTRKTRDLGHFLRKTLGRDSVEAKLEERLTLENTRLSNYFFHDWVRYFEKDSKAKVNRHYVEHTVVVKEVDELIATVLDERGLKKEEALIRIGLDGGGGFLKICMSAFNMRNQKLIKDSINQKFKDSGVKKVLILGITPGVQENYSNVKKMWLECGLDKLDYHYTIATDLKLCNILLGLMNHSSMHPCCWCDIDKNNLDKKGNPRTYSSLLKKFFNYFDAIVDQDKAKQFGNVIHPPILNVDLEDEDTPVIHRVPPPELHLLLGPTQHMIDELSKVWPGVNGWLATLNVKRTDYFGGAFEGNDIRKIVKCAASLAERCPEEFIKYVHALVSFNEVVKSCYGETLHKNYEKDIQNFKAAYLKLPQKSMQSCIMLKNFVSIVELVWVPIVNRHRSPSTKNS